MYFTQVSYCSYRRWNIGKSIPIDGCYGIKRYLEKIYITNFPMTFYTNPYLARHLHDLIERELTNQNLRLYDFLKQIESKNLKTQISGETRNLFLGGSNIKLDN